MNFYDALNLLRDGKMVQTETGLCFYMVNNKLYINSTKWFNAQLSDIPLNKLLEYEWEECVEPDEIFLLSEDEYEKYKNAIPLFECWWWLRTPGAESDHVVGVYNNGVVDCYGSNIKDALSYVRPALYLEPNHFSIGSRINKYNFPWVVIDNDLAIAEVPIAAHRFDKKLNDYELSEIRQFLLDWLEERKSIEEQR